MHRKRAKFAQRVNRVAGALERRGIRATYVLHDRLLSNRRARRRLAAQSPTLDDVQQKTVRQLRAEGYAVLPFSELVPDQETWRELEASAAGFVAASRQGLEQESEGAESELRRSAGKDFVVRKYAYGVQLDIDDPWLRFGANRRLLDVANAYLGMWSKLEYVDVWYTPPVPGRERQLSQRWHRDFNDRRLLKAFLYLVDVDEETGPFEYVPRSAPGGEIGDLWPWRPMGQNYPPQDELIAKVGGRAVTFTAPKGTVIFCNTSGFHRGGFATGKPRVLATVTYSSPASLASLTERNYTFRPSSTPEPLDPEQRFALT